MLNQTWKNLNSVIFKNTEEEYFETMILIIFNKKSHYLDYGDSRWMGNGFE